MDGFVPSASEYLILFGDLVGSTEVAVELSPSAFARTYVGSFHWAAHMAEAYVNNSAVFPKAVFRVPMAPIRIVGDEVVSFTRLPRQNGEMTPEHREDLVACAVAFAYVTKLYWLAGPYNLQRMLGRQFPRDVSFGIHIGPAARVQERAESDIVSLHINVAKRIETHARKGTESRILASYDVTDHFACWRTRIETKTTEEERPPLAFASFVHPVEVADAKGVPKRLQALELALDEAQLNKLDAQILKPLTQTPERVDVTAESAAKILAETFLLTEGKPFAETDGYSVDHAIGGDTAQGYIHQWFNAVEAQPAIWMDEAWLVLNCFFVSCAMLRHSKMDPDEKGRCLNITKGILERLRKLKRRVSPG